MNHPTFALPALTLSLILLAEPLSAQDTRNTETYARVKAALDAVPAIDTHDHLWPFDKLPALRETAKGRGVNLAGVWGNSYYT